MLMGKMASMSLGGKEVLMNGIGKSQPKRRKDRGCRLNRETQAAGKTPAMWSMLHTPRQCANG